MKRTFLAAALSLGTLQCGAVGNLADITVYDRSQGRTLPLYEHEGRHYVVGKPGNRYQINLRNQSGQALLAMTSVDGINVVSGETADWQQSGYVLDSYRRTDIKGWRKSLSRVAQFYFTALGDSYAVRTDRPDHVGVVGVALFRPRAMPPESHHDEEDLSRSEAQPAKERAAENSAAPDMGSADSAGSAPRAKADKKLGTGHGRNETSHTRYVDFERASDTPDEVITIYYDSYRNLLAQGVIPARRAAHEPSPFPGQFVPDPHY